MRGGRGGEGWEQGEEGEGEGLEGEGRKIGQKREGGKKRKILRVRAPRRGGDKGAGGGGEGAGGGGKGAGGWRGLSPCPPPHSIPKPYKADSEKPTLVRSKGNVLAVR